jgi:tRNA pseudouridine38-40 synthase
MPTWKLELEYEGTRYRGWQIQHNVKTIQGEMQEAARQLCAGKFELFGAGRTDAGVHAVRQVAHLKVPELRANVTPTQIQHGFNDVLPHDINILKVANAPENFHARHDAIGRYYLYQISTRRTAFGKSLVWWIKDRLDAGAMSEAAATLVDPALKVHGVQALRVVDGSVMPTVPTANPHTTIVAIAERAADFIKADRRAA